ncbi:hypothetical protein [Micromonospora sp. NPDC007230]|uniref:hypothetical protein n=1 Tax=Micromonospora sp. NPDC007230 TaxID=3364237 RepID=UPI003679406B
MKPSTLNERHRPGEQELRELAALLRSQPRSRAELRELTGLGPGKLGQYLSLEQVGEVCGHCDN